jgi:hypothetical protein
MSNPRRQHRTHTQTQTHRTHPKPRIRLTPTTRPTTTSPAVPTPVPSRRRNHLGVHSPIHQPISLKQAFALLNVASTAAPRRNDTQRTPPLGWVKLPDFPTCPISPEPS